MSKYDEEEGGVVRDGGAVHVPLVRIDGTRKRLARSHAGGRSCVWQASRRSPGRRRSPLYLKQCRARCSTIRVSTSGRSARIARVHTVGGGA